MKSQRIAIAGGTGRIGRHIVEGLLEIKHRYSLEIIVLSRSQSPHISYAGTSAPVLPIDYQDLSSIQKILNDFQIDTVISTLSGTTSDPFITSQENLLRAALSVPSIRRFAPSEFSVNSEQVPSVELYQMKIPIIRSLRQVKQERPDFEYSLFSCGVFMNYLGYGNNKPEGHKAHGYMPHFPYIFDLSKRSADIPGDGEKQLVYTRAEDVGKFLAAATQLEAWEEYNEMAGDVRWLMIFCVCPTRYQIRREIQFPRGNISEIGTPRKSYGELFCGILTRPHGRRMRCQKAYQSERVSRRETYDSATISRTMVGLTLEIYSA